MSDYLEPGKPTKKQIKNHSRALRELVKWCRKYNAVISVNDGVRDVVEVEFDGKYGYDNGMITPKTSSFLGADWGRISITTPAPKKGE